MEAEKNGAGEAPQAHYVIAGDWSPRQYDSLEGLYGKLRIFFYILVVLDAAVIANSVMGLIWLHGVDDQMLDPTMWAEHSKGGLTVFLTFFHAVAWVTCGITFLVWFGRAYDNNIAFQPSDPPHKLPWAYFAWITPVIGLWRPYQMMKWVARGANALNDDSERVLGWWWALWLISAAGSNVVQRYTSSKEFTDYATGQYLTLLQAAIEIAAIILCLQVLRFMTEAQEALARDATASWHQGSAKETV